MNKRYFLFDDDGIIGIANAQSYTSFVHNEWDIEQLKSHFISEMNKNNLIVWQANNSGGGDWYIEILTEPSPTKSFREFSKSIKVTNGNLHIVSYTDLSMAAQFEDEILPSPQNESLVYHLPNGDYNLVIRQMFNPENEMGFEFSETAFEIIVSESKCAENNVNEIFWWVES